MGSGSGQWSVEHRAPLRTESLLYYQIEPEVASTLAKSKALVDLLDEIVEEPLFNQLRTKEQLGYVVDCSPRVTYRILGFCFRVQSSEYTPIYLQGRIDNFINELEGLLNFRSGLIAKLQEKYPSLTYETNRYWGQITDQRYMFDLSAKEAEAVKCLQKCDVMDWYNTYLRPSSPKCRRLAVRVWGCNTNINESKPVSTSVQAAPYLEQAEYDSGNHLEDLKAHSLIRQLIHNPKLQDACPLPFDEAKLWQDYEHDSMVASDGVFGKYLGKILDYYFDYHRDAYSMKGVYLHDPTALLAAVNPSLMTYTEGVVRVQTTGITRGLTLFFNKQKRWNFFLFISVVAYSFLSLSHCFLTVLVP